VKILDKYLLKTFLTTFATVFVILFFIFILQVVWLFISELAGKDLDLIMIGKFLLFKMPSVVPLVLPLSVLLSSIMTFGSLAENYEFAAMKSSGISLQRAMRNLTYFIFVLSLVAFLFANNVIPYAEYKFVNVRRNIAQVKPAMAIAEGQFSDVGDYNIKVEKKWGDNGKYLKLVTIHRKSNMGSGSTTVIKSKTGELVSSQNSNTLKLVLSDGDYYEDIIPTKYEERNKLPFAKSSFKRYVLNIDLSKLNTAAMDNAEISNTNSMMNVSELRYTIDSLQRNYKKDVLSYTENIYQRYGTTANYIVNPNSTVTLSDVDILQRFNANDKIQILRVASSTVDGTHFALENSKFELEGKQKNISEHYIAFYDKFVIAFSCILMFFIGAPLGAIIKKGGLGLPIVFAILIFITFHFINTFGKRVAQEDGITPFLGCWMATIILTPLGIFLTKRATEDKGVTIDFGWFVRLYRRYFPAKVEDLLVVATGMHPGFTVAQEHDVEAMPYEAQVTAEEVLHEPIAIDKVTTLARLYQNYSLGALVSNVVLLGIVFSKLVEGTLFIVLTSVLAVVFFGLVYMAQQRLQHIAKTSHTVLDLPSFIVLLGGFPFFVLFYLFNKSYLKDVILSLKKESDGSN
jgi:lipopolysaccharide export system permease protein